MRRLDLHVELAVGLLQEVEDLVARFFVELYQLALIVEVVPARVAGREHRALLRMRLDERGQVRLVVRGALGVYHRAHHDHAFGLHIG